MNCGRVPFFRQTTRVLREAAYPRREFLRRSAAAALGALSAPLAWGKEVKPGDPVDAIPVGKFDGPVAVIGGGVAGLTAAWRLKQAGAEVVVFEGSERLGGRIFTRRKFNKDGMFVELGGELIDTGHTALMGLARELGLEMQSLREGEQGVEFYFFGGKHRTDKDLIPLYQPMAARIAADAEGITNADDEWTDKARQFDAVTLKDYLQKVGAGIEKWLVDMIEVAYVIEYGVDAEKQSAINLLSIMGTDTSEGFEIFGDSDEAWRIQGGNENLTAALAQRIGSQAKTGHRWVKVASEADKLKLTFVAREGVVTKTFTHVICALPFTTLREVQGIYDLALSDEKKKAIREFGYGSNLKVMFGFTDRHWRKPLPGREDFCNGNLYADLPFQTVWESSRSQDGQSGILTNFMGGTTGAQYTADRLEKFLAELDKVFPGIRSKYDKNSTMMNWPAMKWMKASYSCPLVGQATWIADAAAAAELKGRICFAGEHTSADFGGFMNGGVESGQRAAKELAAATL